MKLMYKPVVKLAFLTILFSFIGVFLSGGKVSAAKCNWAPSDWWGINYGANLHGFAGLKVHAFNGGNPSQELNVSYELHSKMPNPRDNYDVPAGVGDYNAKILNEPIPGGGRDSDHWFTTGEIIYGGSGGPLNCDGWSVLGHGNSTSQGNRWVLDCSDPNIKTGNQDSTQFWISNITKPSGEAGRYGGYWEIQLDGSAAAGTPNLNNRPMNHFTMVNGETRRIDLIWHPNAPPPPNPTVEGRCEQLYVNGWGAYDTGASLPNGSPRWRDTKTYVRVTDGNGNVLVDDVLDGGPGPPGYNQDRTWHYKPHTMTVTIKVIRKWHKRSGTSYFWYEPTSPVDGYDPGNNTHTYNCFNANCSLEVQGNVPGHSNGVKSRSGFSITAKVNNVGTPEGYEPLPAQIDGRPLILASNPGSPVGFWYNPAAPSGISKNNPSNPDEENTWNPGDGIVEPGWSIGTYGVGAKLYYDFNPAPGIQGGDLVIADCTGTSYDVYKQFHLNVTANIELNPTVEDPSEVKYVGRGDGNVPDYPGGINVNYSANARGDVYGGGTQCVNNSSGTGHTAVVYSYSCTPPSNRAGDKYSLDFCINQTDGWIGPGNQFSDDTFGACDSESAYTYDRPYVSIYGADAISGSAFKTGDTCNTAGNQTIKAYRSTIGSKGGSGVQFAALALDQISGFRSASVRGSNKTELTFANVDAADKTGSLSDDQPKDGGKYNGQSICTEDFYSTMKNPADIVTTNASANINTSSQIEDNKQTFFNRSGNNLTITSNGSDFTKQATLFVDGNVIINDNITFQPGKYLSIIAKGNIYINKNVTRLDGVYVAQPRNDGTRGNIYTCTTGSNPYAVTDLYDNCRSQLVVNGAFAAKSVKLLRVANSLRQSSNNEKPSNFSTGDGTKAAEIFNFSPEIYLFTPVFYDVSTNQPYQYLTTLPPVL